MYSAAQPTTPTLAPTPAQLDSSPAALIVCSALGAVLVVSAVTRLRARQGSSRDTSAVQRSDAPSSGQRRRWLLVLGLCLGGGLCTGVAICSSRAGTNKDEASAPGQSSTMSPSRAPTRLSVAPTSTTAPTANPTKANPSPPPLSISFSSR
jgi:hypothetical protein